MTCGGDDGGSGKSGDGEGSTGAGGDDGAVDGEETELGRFVWAAGKRDSRRMDKGIRFVAGMEGGLGGEGGGETNLKLGRL